MTSAAENIVTRCDLHPSQTAHWYCRTCVKSLCERCTKVGVNERICLSCQEPCREISSLGIEKVVWLRQKDEEEKRLAKALLSRQRERLEKERVERETRLKNLIEVRKSERANEPQIFEKKKSVTPISQADSTHGHPPAAVSTSSVPADVKIGDAVKSQPEPAAKPTLFARPSVAPPKAVADADTIVPLPVPPTSVPVDPAEPEVLQPIYVPPELLAAAHAVAEGIVFDSRALDMSGGSPVRPYGTPVRYEGFPVRYDGTPTPIGMIFTPILTVAPREAIFAPKPPATPGGVIFSRQTPAPSGAAVVIREVPSAPVEIAVESEPLPAPRPSDPSAIDPMLLLGERAYLKAVTRGALTMFIAGIALIFVYSTFTYLLLDDESKWDKSVAEVKSTELIRLRKQLAESDSSDKREQAERDIARVNDDNWVTTPAGQKKVPFMALKIMYGLSIALGVTLIILSFRSEISPIRAPAIACIASVIVTVFAMLIRIDTFETIGRWLIVVMLFRALLAGYRLQEYRQENLAQRCGKCHS